MAANHHLSTVSEERLLNSSMSLLPPRPNPTGSIGESECLYTNHFISSFPDNIPLYQYDISIEEISSNNSTNWYEIKSRARCAFIIQSFLIDHQLDPNIFVWYDEQKCLYSTSYLSTPQLRINGRNRLNIKSLTNQWSTNNIHAYINGQTNVYPYDAVRILETLLKKSIQEEVEVINNKCYFKNQQAQKFENGFEQRQGFIQALHLSSQRLTLNLQTKLTTFYSNISLLDFIHKQINGNQIPVINDYQKLNELLSNCLIVTQQSNWKKAYEFDRFDARRPGEICIETGQTLIEYYREKNIILTKTNYPCIQVYSIDNYHNLCYLPLELCRIKEHQVYNNPVSFAHGREEGKQIPTPEERYYKILHTLQKCDYNSRLLCRTINFHINDQNMLAFDARILTPPEIKSSCHTFARVKDGRIYLEGQLYQPIPISTLAMTYFGTNFIQYKKEVERFMDKLVEVMRDYHIYGCHEEHMVEPIWTNIDGYFDSMNARKCQFIVCIMNAESEESFTRLKSHIKKCGTIKYGIMTQCTIFTETPSDEKSLANYCENLVRKINFKNRGINTIVNFDLALKRSSVMFFGADVIHPTNVTRQHPSIAAVVGSGDSTCSRTAGRVCKQYPKEGKCSIELILGMTEMVEQLLNYNFQCNGCLPKKIIFYRDGKWSFYIRLFDIKYHLGVDDGQFRKILDYEIPAIRQAFNSNLQSTTKI